MLGGLFSLLLYILFLSLVSFLFLDWYNKNKSVITYYEISKHPGDYSIPGIGNVQIGINELQDSGVMFCVCAMAINVNSTIIAQNMKLNAEDVKKDLLSGILPGIQVVPSGVWAVGRAQEHGCASTCNGFLTSFFY